MSHAAIASSRSHHHRPRRVRGGKWYLEHPIGSGGLTTVYAARDARGRRVAVKVLHEHAAREPLLRERFMNEGLVTKAIGHRGAVRVLAHDVMEDGSPLLVMERLDGETLEARRTRCGGRLAPAEAVRVVLEMLDVLAAAHAKNITHGNIKPTNVMLTNSGAVKVLEFGVAVETSSVGTRTTPHKQSAAFQFMAPEQTARAANNNSNYNSNSNSVDVRAAADIFAVGATLFTLLSGQYPYGEISAIEFRRSSVRNFTRPRSLECVAPNISAALVAIVDCALELDPAKRFADVGSMASALRRAIEAPRAHVPYSSTTIALATVPRFTTSSSSSHTTTIPPTLTTPSRPSSLPSHSHFGASALPFSQQQQPQVTRRSTASSPGADAFAFNSGVRPIMTAFAPAAPITMAMATPSTSTSTSTSRSRSTSTSASVSSSSERARAVTVPSIARVDQRLLAVLLGFALALLIGSAVRVVQVLMEPSAATTSTMVRR